MRAEMATPLGARVMLSPAPEHLAGKHPGSVMFHVRMDDYGDGREFEVLLSRENREQLAVALMTRITVTKRGGRWIVAREGGSWPHGVWSTWAAAMHHAGTVARSLARALG